MPLPTRHILVCTNERPADRGKPSCAPRGADEVLSELKSAVKAAGLKDSVWVTKSGCLKHCSLGVTVMVWPERLLLGGVTEADVPEIVETCGRAGKMIERLKMADIPWE